MKWDGIPEHWGKGYYRDVPISRYVKLCRERQVQDLKRAQEKDPTFPYYYDWEAGERAVWFISLLRQFEQPFYNHPLILADWQEWDIIRPIFGWKKMDGTRRFKEAAIFIPKKNGKSTLAGAIANYLLNADQEYGAQVVCGATKEDQAKIVWDAARRMMELSPELRDEIKSFKRAFVNHTLGARCFPLGKDSKTNDGLNIHGGIVDEYHAHKNSDVRDIIRQGMATRLQPLFLLITTLGYGEQTPCDEEFKLATDILQGTVRNENYFSFVATVDDPEKWDQEEEWLKANPNLGISISLDRFREDFDSANVSPRKREEFKCKRLNIKGKKYGTWIAMDKFRECGGKIDWSLFRGKRCFAGLDLGITRDISALTLAFADEGEITRDDSGKLLQANISILNKYWISEEGMYERYQNDGVPYPQWVEEGWISTTPGPATRYDIIRRDINDLAEQFEIAELAIDRAHGHQLMTELSDDGLTIVKHAQTMLAMNFPCRSFEELVLEGRLRHGDDPVFAWMVSNVAIVRDGCDNIKIVKDRSGDRVDGVVSAVMAIGRLLIAPEPTNFVYNFMGMYMR